MKRIRITIDFPNVLEDPVPTIFYGISYPPPLPRSDKYNVVIFKNYVSMNLASTWIHFTPSFFSGSGNYSMNSAICAMLLFDVPNFPFYEMSTIVFFFVPMIIMVILYTKMGIAIRNRFGSNNRHETVPIQCHLYNFHQDTGNLRTSKSITHMLSKYKVSKKIILFSKNH